jgi:hypothetical protein
MGREERSTTSFKTNRVKPKVKIRFHGSTLILEKRDEKRAQCARF